jgi:hypothetical protein
MDRRISAVGSFYSDAAVQDNTPFLVEVKFIDGGIH